MEEYRESKLNTYILESITSNVYKYNLDTTLEEPQDFRDLTHLLDTAEEQDTIVIRVNTYGGDIYSMISIINSIQNSKALVIAEVALASSAGSFIALACDDCGSLQFSEWFFHEVQSHNRGSTSDQIKSLSFRHKTQKHLMEELYKGFMTDEEIEKLCKGEIRDWEMDYIEANERLVKWREYKLQKQQLNEDTEDNTENIDKFDEEDKVNKVEGE